MRVTSRTRAVAATAVLATIAGATGCAHPMQRKLEGRWLGDSVENFDSELVAAATGWAKGTSMEFSGSNMTVAVPAEEPTPGISTSVSNVATEPETKCISSSTATT